MVCLSQLADTGGTCVSFVSIISPKLSHCSIFASVLPLRANPSAKRSYFSFDWSIVGRLWI